MGDTRIRYGLAWGRQNNFYTGNTDQTKRGYLAGTDGLFTQANTSPDVTTGYLFFTNNSAATTITNFQVTAPFSGGNIAGLFEGKEIRVFFLDTNTTIQNNSRVVLMDSADHLFNSNTMVDFIYHTSSWYEICRGEIIPLNSQATRSLSIAGTNYALTVTPGDMNIVVTGTIAATTITGISGGYIGQQITIIQGSGGASLIISNTGSAVGAGNIYFMGTDSFRIGGISSANGLNNIILSKTNSAFWTVINSVLPR
jgi:hypothetical protein